MPSTQRRRQRRCPPPPAPRRLFSHRRRLHHPAEGVRRPPRVTSSRLPPLVDSRSAGRWCRGTALSRSAGVLRGTALPPQAGRPLERAVGQVRAVLTTSATGSPTRGASADRGHGRGQPRRALHPQGRRARVPGAARFVHDLPGRRVLRQQRRAGDPLERSGAWASIGAPAESASLSERDAKNPRLPTSRRPSPAVARSRVGK